MAEDLLIQDIEERDLEYVDKRARGGALWIVGDESLRAEIVELQTAHDVTFQYAPNGGRATKRRAAWWLPAARTDSNAQ
jgi:hypothetical protein